MIRVGSVVISVDAELAWGYHDYDSLPEGRLEAARPGWSRLADLFERYELPATWAVVGHLFLESCDRTHADHPAPDSWFDWERGGDGSRPELRFAPELVDDLVRSEVDHDIGCHTFSHVEFGGSETTRELARAEVQACVRAARERGIEPRSFVFPRNSVGHRAVLADGPIRCYRDGSGATPGGVFQPVRKLSRATLGDEFLVRPQRDEYGLVNVPRSLYLFGFEDPFRALFEPFLGDPILRMVRLGLDQAEREDGIFHLSLHPNDLTSERKVERIEAVVSTIAHRRRRSGIEVETMRDVAERVLDAHPPDVDS